MSVSTHTYGTLRTRYKKITDLLFKRLHLFEFNDQPWFKGFMREAFMDCLGFAKKIFKPYEHIHISFAKLSKLTGHNAVLDLGSGGGGNIETILYYADLEKVKLPRIIASDLYPNIETYAKLKEKYGDGFNYIALPVSALGDTQNDIKLRSICTAFHHFRPDDAKKIIHSAMANGDGIIIAELTCRTLRNLVAIPIGLPVHMAAALFAPVFKWKKFFVTTIFPIIPLMVIFDAMVSVLRSYREEELREMAREVLGHEEQYTLEYELQPFFGFLRSSSCLIYRTKNPENP